MAPIAIPTVLYVYQNDFLIISKGILFFRDIKLATDLSSKDYDALVIVAAQLNDIKDSVDSSVFQTLQVFSEVRIS